MKRALTQALSRLVFIVLLCGFGFTSKAHGQLANGCETLYVDSSVATDSTGHPVMHAWASTTDLATSGGTSCLIGQEMATNSYPYTHRYTTGIKITSPKGKVISLTTFGQQQGRAGTGSNTANTSMAICDPLSELPVNCDAGRWTYTGTESTSCSYAGTFFGGGGGSSLTVAITVTYGKDALPEPAPEPDGRICNYTNACSNNVVPTCDAGLYSVFFAGKNVLCPAYDHSSFLVIKQAGKLNHCIIGVSIPASGPGPCS